jgi:hypothetical protein
MDYFSKEKYRKVIARKTRDFLAAGGVIEVVPGRCFVPHWHRWMIKYGWDYHPWTLRGFPSVANNADMVGPGCYVTLSAKTGDD